MAFIESPRFPDAIAWWATGGPEYKTEVIGVATGYEKRNVLWAYPRGRYDLSSAMAALYSSGALQGVDFVREFFHSCQGRANGFRMRDFQDYTDAMAGGQGFLGLGVGTGLPTYQMQKLYNQGNQIYRQIRKPVSGSIAVQRNAGAVTFGGAAGNCALDTTTGIVTFVADATSAASAITVGATTQVTMAANLGLAANKLLYLSGFTGADASLVNGIAHTINSVTGAGPYIFTLATNTAGKTITLGIGLGSKFPQASDTLTWAGQFDVPVRFDTDSLLGTPTEQGLYNWASIPIVEIRV